MCKLFITGSKGQLGRCLFQLIREEYPSWKVIETDMDTLDITDEQAVREVFAKISPDFIINAAAYTAVDKAESEPELAFAVNATAVSYLAAIAEEKNAELIHISTDYVFDGKKNVPYRPDDEVNPKSVYGKSKAAGEQAIVTSGCCAAIFRTAWLYSEFGNNFVKTMLRLADEGKEIKVVNDQYGSPTSAEDLAREILYYICMKNKNPKFKNQEQKKYTIYHYTNQGTTTWFEFARKIMELNGKSCKVLPVSTAEYFTVAFRPPYSVLDLSETMQEINLPIPSWEDGLQRMLENIQTNKC
jgi:dTDP-4-dehydrorhamnose reductase